MKPPRFDYACPATLGEAVALLARHRGEAKPLAGGQSLMPVLAFRLAEPSAARRSAQAARARPHRHRRRRSASRRARCAGATSSATSGSPRRIRCCRRRSRMSRIIRSAIAAPSAAASRMPIPPRRCRASPSPAMARSRSSARRARGQSRRPISSPGRSRRRWRPTRSSPSCVCRPGPRRGAGASRNSRAGAAISRSPASRCSTISKRGGRAAMRISP